MSTSGKFAVARLGSTTGGTDNPAGAAVKGLQEWTAEEHADELDASDGENLAENTDTGMVGLTVTIKAVQKVSDGVPVNYRVGTKLQDLKLYYSRIGTFDLAWHCPWAVVTRVSNPVRVKGQKECTITIRSKGVFAGPGDTALTAVPDPDL